MKKKRNKTFRLLLIAAALIALLSISAFAMSGWYTKTFLLEDKPELTSMVQQAMDDASRFSGTNANEAEISPVASYENGEYAQSGVYRFSTTSGSIGYYETGEIQFIDCRSSEPENLTGIQKYSDPYENFFANDADMDSYVEKLEEAAPVILDALQQDGWIQGHSEEIARVWVNDIYGKDTIFNGPTATIHVLMVDDTAYELWLNPETLECEGFMFWKAEDMPNTRNGLFAALKEGKQAQWQYDVSHNPHAVG